MASSQYRLTADLSPEGCYGREWNALIKLDGRFDPTLIAGLASPHHAEEGLRQDFGRDVLGLAVRLDQCDEPEVGFHTDWGHNGRAFRHRWATIAKQMLAVPKSRNATIERRLARLRTCALTAAIWPSN